MVGQDGECFLSQEQKDKTMIEKREILLKVSDLSLSFGTNKVLKDINFTVRNIINTDFPGQGQVISLLGKSGIGKSCLFNCLAGLLAPDTGEILVNENQTKVRAGDMGVVFQDYYIFTWMKVKDILMDSVKKNPTISKEERKDAIANIAEQFNLVDHLEKYSHVLSGGQKQRVAIAEQILNGGNFLLLDEPFSGLDVIVMEKVIDTFLKVSTTDELKTIIIVSHDLSNSVSLSDTVFVLNKPDPNEGATIVKEIDLIERGLAYRPGIKDEPKFRETLKEIKELMR